MTALLFFCISALGKEFHIKQSPTLEDCQVQNHIKPNFGRNTPICYTGNVEKSIYFAYLSLGFIQAHDFGFKKNMTNHSILSNVEKFHFADIVIYWL